jgi:hypothetical protein
LDDLNKLVLAFSYHRNENLQVFGKERSSMEEKQSQSHYLQNMLLTELTLFILLDLFLKLPSVKDAQRLQQNRASQSRYHHGGFDTHARQKPSERVISFQRHQTSIDVVYSKFTTLELH